MRSFLDDSALIDHKDPIGVPYRFEPVRDHDDGLVLGQRADRGLQAISVFRVHIRRRFVENDDRRVLQHRACNGDPLPFPAGKVRSSTAYNGIISFLQRIDKAVAARHMRGGLYLCVCRVQPSHADILAHGIVKEIVVL